MVDLPEAVTVTEAAQALRLHPQTVRAMIRDGRLSAVRFGRAIRIPATELARLTTTTEQQ